MDEIEFDTGKEEGVIHNCEQIKKYCDSYIRKVAEIRTDLQRNRHTSEFRKKYYDAKKLVSRLYSCTYELMLELELEDPLGSEEDEENEKLIEVPCLPSIDGEFQKHKFEMQFLHGNSPWNFWLSHCEENITRRLKELLQKRTYEQKNTNLYELVEKPIIGDYVLYMQGKEPHLRRAVILKHLSSERYQILDIDKGTIAVVRLQRLFKMDEEMSSIPYQAVHCTLMKDSEDSQLWNEDVESLFVSLLFQCKLTVKIIQKNPGFPTCFYVKMKATDVNETERTLDVGKWITDRIIPGLRSDASLSGDMLDVFFNEDCDDDSSDSCYGDDSSETLSKSPIIELPNDDNEEMVSSQASRTLKSDMKPSLELVPVAASNAVPFSQPTAPNTIHNASTSRKIAANFNEFPRRDNPPTNNMMAVYPLMPISPTAGSMRGYPVIPRPPNPMSSNASLLLNGYPLTQTIPNGGVFRTNLGPAMRYPFESRPSPSHGMPQSQWSSNDLNTVQHDFNQSYGMSNAKFELKSPIILVRPNEELRATCSYILSPNEFYVHLVNKNNVKIDVLGVDLERFYSGCNLSDYQLRPGSKYCACKYIWHENYREAPLTTWFRAEILSMKANEARVFLVDYGITLTKNVVELRALDQRFFVYDKMAQRCHLHAVPMMEAEYSEDVSNHFKSLLESKKHSQQLNINVFNNVQTRACSLSVVVKLPEREKTINELIIDFIKSKEEENHEWDPMSEDFHAETNRLDHVIDNALMATCGFVPKDDEKVCRFYARNGRCMKKSCRQEHIFMGEDVFTVDRVETFAQTIGKQKLPEQGSRLKIKVLKNACITHKRFYGHWRYANAADGISKYGKFKYDDDDDEDVGSEYYDDEEKEETLITLMKALNEPNNTRKYKLAEFPALGELVIARVFEDDHGSVWYRAQVTEVHESFCIVFLIDFGSVKQVSMKRMRAMEPRFLHLPAQATEFCVAGVELLEDEWAPTDRPTSILSQWEDTVLDAFVVKTFHSSIDVKLWNAEGESIRTKLIETGKYRFGVDSTCGEDSGPLPG